MKKLIYFMVVMVIGVFITGCVRKPIEYKDTKLILSVSESLNDHYTKDEVSFLIFESDKEFTIRYPDHGVGKDKKFWHMKYIVDEDRDTEIYTYIEKNNHIIREYPNVNNDKVIIFNTDNGTIVKYMPNYRSFELWSFSIETSDPMSRLLYTFPFNSENFEDIKEDRGKVLITSSTYNIDDVIQWYIKYCNGRKINDEFIFTYIKYDFKLTIVEVNDSVEFQIEKYIE